jgi:hypothetical protein
MIRARTFDFIFITPSVYRSIYKINLNINLVKTLLYLRFNHLVFGGSFVFIEQDYSSKALNTQNLGQGYYLALHLYNIIRCVSSGHEAAILFKRI